MSFENVISVHQVSKVYRVYEKPQDRLKQALWGKKKQFYREFIALNNISFDLAKGSSIGIIGRNGSGKSTLLQILCDTLSPTSGTVEVKGRVAALLELGSGFNPEFSGRENVFLNGAIMGLSRKEMEDRMQSIEEFADIGEFIDQPVKTYSSGMFVRLAFACAVNVDPEILIVDEALAVGDLNFQLKCIEKMKSFKEAGKTIIFVSHDTYTVKNFCDQAIWLMNGHIHMRGNVNTVVDSYEDYMKGKNGIDSMSSGASVSGDVLSIDAINFTNSLGESKDSFQFGENVEVIVDYTLYKPVESVVGGIAIFDRELHYVCGLNTKLDRVKLPNTPGKHQLKLKYLDMNLMAGTYFVDVAFFESSAVVALDYKNKSTSFRIDSSDYFAEGLTFIKHKWISEG
ncbi:MULTISPECIES: ABC transporter ATP-binding protein [Paenibacillus]|uniref:ABC transporter ATP-binding protein n=1 Tax=Paenibacillus TaxID=44249 RepID=UPI0011A2DFFA|nr:ABC transporter ATP-binding protein [Paenibacillus sp. IHBB 10380]